MANVKPTFAKLKLQKNVEVKTIVFNDFEIETYAMIFDDDNVENLKIPYIKYGAADYKNLSHNLFDSLRELDKIGAKQCFVRYPDDENKDNLAVLNRLLRAAGFNVIEV